jgi:hypothetical protein
MNASTKELGSLSVSQLKVELESRQRKMDSLQRRRQHTVKMMSMLDSLISKIRDGIDQTGAEIKKNSSDAGTHKYVSAVKPKKGFKSLVVAIEKVLSGNPPMKIGEIEKAVVKIGYKSKSKTFRLIVNQTLLNNKSKFRKVSRATYTTSTPVGKGKVERKSVQKTSKNNVGK